MPIRVKDAHHLPTGPCVIVANHASYLDGLVLKAALPARFCFVIKKEVTRVPIAGLLLRRIGSEFVDRFNRHAGGMDARRLIKAADAGQALAFFPEGTFLPHPGRREISHRGVRDRRSRRRCLSCPSGYAARAAFCRAVDSAAPGRHRHPRVARRSGLPRPGRRRRDHSGSRPIARADRGRDGRARPVGERRRRRTPRPTVVIRPRSSSRDWRTVDAAVARIHRAHHARRRTCKPQFLTVRATCVKARIVPKR